MVVIHGISPGSVEIKKNICKNYVHLDTLVIEIRVDILQVKIQENPIIVYIVEVIDET